MNNKLKKKEKMTLKKTFFKLNNNAVIRKTMENVRSHGKLR